MTDKRHFFPEFKYNSKTSLVLGCTRPVAVIKETAIYEDTLGRIYSVRNELTAIANGMDVEKLRSGEIKELTFDNAQPEKFICFDYYIKKKLHIADKPFEFKSARERGSPKVKTTLLPGEKGSTPFPGEIIHLQRLHQTSKDDPQRNYVDVEVIEVHPGDITLTHEEHGTLANFNKHVGMVQVQVIEYEKYGGSLCLPPALRSKVLGRDYAA